MRAFLLKLISVALIGSGGYYTWDKVSAPKLDLKSNIVMYADGDDHTARTVMELLKLKKLLCGFVPVKNMQDIVALKMMERLKDAGIASSDGNSVSTPYFSIDGKLVRHEKFMALLARLPLPYSEEYPYAYIVVYGIPGCGFTYSGIRELEDNNLKYEFRDVNDPRYRPRFDALMAARDIKSIDWPVMDVSGHILVKPPIETILKYYH
jgi:hypothetical protein